MYPDLFSTTLLKSNYTHLSFCGKWNNSGFLQYLKLILSPKYYSKLLVHIYPSPLKKNYDKNYDKSVDTNPMHDEINAKLSMTKIISSQKKTKQFMTKHIHHRNIYTKKRKKTT